MRRSGRPAKRAPASAARTLRRDWPFRRVALVLTGGGALGAYQVGVLRVLESLGLRPPIVAGLSVGAINAVAWVACGFDSAALERTWRRAGPSSIGMRWTTLTLRLFGLFLVALASLEVVLTLVGSDELIVAHGLLRRVAGRTEVPGVLFESAAWLLVWLLGFSLSKLARRVDDWISRSRAGTDPRAWHAAFGWLLLGLGAAHLASWALAWPWPRRFSATALVLGFVVWMLNRPGAAGDWARATVMRALPESGGRGLWRGLARRRLLERLVAHGRAERLVAGDVHLLVNAVAMQSGRLCYFVNWPDSSPAFRAAMDQALAQLIEVRTPREVIDAAIASSAIPLLFQPVRIAGRDYVDAGMFSSRVLHAVLADGADAILVVLMTPAEWRLEERGQTHLLEVGARLLELGNWRDLRGELLTLPASWSRSGDPARVCAVEPAEELPGGLLEFHPHTAQALIERGMEDTWRALERAGWLAPAAEAGEGQGGPVP